MCWLSRGARLELGGAWLKPSFLCDLTTEMDINYQKVFGAAALFFKARDAEEAICLTNDSPFGLASAIMTTVVVMMLL